MINETGNIRIGYDSHAYLTDGCREMDCLMYKALSSYDEGEGDVLPPLSSYEMWLKGYMQNWLNQAISDKPDEMEW